MFSGYVGGAPVTKAFADSINADEYFSDPQGMLDYLNKKMNHNIYGKFNILKTIYPKRIQIQL